MLINLEKFVDRHFMCNSNELFLVYKNIYKSFFLLYVVFVFQIFLQYSNECRRLRDVLFMPE